MEEEEINWTEYFDRRRYDLGVGTLFPYREHARRAVEALSLFVGARVLDTGCGSGQITKIMIDSCPGLEVMAIDGSATALLAAKERLLGANIHFAQVDLNASDWDVGTEFDRVLSTMVLYALQDPISYLQQVRRAMKKDGIFVLVNLSDPTAIYNVLDEHNRWLAEEATAEEIAYDASPEVQAARELVIKINEAIVLRDDLFTPASESLVPMVESAGFRVLHTDPLAYSGIATLIVARAA